MTISSNPLDTSPIITARPATTDDAEQISSLGIRMFYKTFTGTGPSPEQMKNYLSKAMSPAAIETDIANPDRTVFVATTPDGQVVGFSMLLRGRIEDCLADYGRPIELERLYIDSYYHGRGVAKLLCMDMDQMARAEGYENMWVGVWEGNFRALAFYAKVGFRKVGDRLFDVGGDLANDWVLFKDL